MPDTRPVLARGIAPITVGVVVGAVGNGGTAVHCGVRDYAVCLAAALRDAGIEAKVMSPPSWGLRDGLAFVRSFRAERLDVIHLQYPSIGHRRSLLPHVLGPLTSGSRFVVTLHEHSALPRVQRIANVLFQLTADRLVFTTTFEAGAFGAGPDGFVIPIGSNVPAVPDGCREDVVLYFGQLRPDKGIESFIRLAALSAASDEATRFVVIGSAPPRWQEYAQGLTMQAPANLSWLQDAPFGVVANAMATSLAAYLPFPDGAGLRRGSLIAALTNGLPIIAPLGSSTTEELRAVLLSADTPEAAFSRLAELRTAPALARRLGGAGRALARRFGWVAVAEAHVGLYRSLLTGGAPTEPLHLDPASSNG